MSQRQDRLEPVEVREVKEEYVGIVYSLTNSKAQVHTVQFKHILTAFCYTFRLFLYLYLTSSIEDDGLSSKWSPILKFTFPRRRVCSLLQICRHLYWGTAIAQWLRCWFDPSWCK